MTAEPHKDRAHSRLGASIAYRWMNCPGSVRETAGLGSDSFYAAEGTAAHELAQRCLTLPADDLRVAHDFIGEEIVVGNHVFTVDEDMADAVHLYCETVGEDWQDGDVLHVEKRFSLEQIRAGMFGTNDALRYRPSTKRLVVYDYKHGAGKAVYPDDNPQLLYYALGAALAHAWPIEELELVIVQPRAGGAPVRRWTTDMMHLVSFMSALEIAADAALDPAAPCRAGDWCKESFCPKAGSCATLEAHARAAAKMEFSVMPASHMAPDNMAAILEEADVVEAWIDAVRAEAYRRANAGDPLPGWKVVDKVGRRKWKLRDDPEAVARLLEQRFGLTDEAFSEPKLKTPPQIEKLLPAAAKKQLAEHYETVSSGTTLVRETDRRPAVRRSTAAEDFGPTTQGN